MSVWLRSGLVASVGLMAGCECGGPFAMVDCALPGLVVAIVDADGNPTRYDVARTYQDGELVEELVCTPLDDTCTSVFAAVLEVGTYRVEVDVDGVTYAYDEVVDDIPDTGCCGGFFFDAELAVVPGPDADSCADLDEADCAREPSCYALAGFPLSDAEDCVDYDHPAFAICEEPRDCDASLSLARPADGGGCLLFTSCTPDGWVACEGDIPAECPS